MQVTGIILTGGKSLRMGTDKALIELSGQTLLQRAIELCQPFCSTILISSDNSDHGKYGYPVIPDEIENCGPMGGIYSCLKKSENSWNFVLSVDATFVVPEFIPFLISETNDYDAVIPSHNKGKEPLIAFYHKNCLPVIKNLLDTENYKMHNLLEKINANFVETQYWIEKHPDIFRNLNRPEDF